MKRARHATRLSNARVTVKARQAVHALSLCVSSRSHDDDDDDVDNEVRGLQGIGGSTSAWHHEGYDASGYTVMVRESHCPCRWDDNDKRIKPLSDST